MAVTRRLERGRSHSYLLDGKPVDGVTTVLSNGLPKPALVPWAAREVARFASSNRQLVQTLQEDELFDLFKGAPFRDRDRAANRGGEVHRLAQRLAQGKEVSVPDELIGHVDAYLKFREVWTPSEEILEFSVFSRRHRYAGTADLWARIRGLGRTLLDFKTNRSGPFGEVGLQLAAYANAEFMLSPTGEEVPIPPIDSFAVLWLRADGFDLYPYEVTERDFRTFLYIQQVAWWLNNRSRVIRQDALALPEEVAP